MLAMPPMSMLFKVIPSARISIGTFNRPIQETRWYKAHTTNQMDRLVGLDFTARNHPFDLKAAFACAAYMVAEVDVHPDVMGRVFGMAFEDSLYVDMRVSVSQV